MENNNCKNINSQIVEDNIGEKKKISFESMMKKVNHRFNTNTNSPLNKKDANIFLGNLKLFDVVSFCSL